MSTDVHPCLVFLQTIALYLDYKQDESYTPNKISIGAGNSCDDLKVRSPRQLSMNVTECSWCSIEVPAKLSYCLACVVHFRVLRLWCFVLWCHCGWEQEIKVVELTEPCGWVPISLRPDNQR